MTLDPARRSSRRAPLTPAARALVTILILVPLVGLAIVPVYSRQSPRLWGFPFFYWYQLAWVFLAALCTYAARLVMARGRDDRYHR